MRRFRFGLHLGSPSVAECVRRSRKAEALGFDVVLVGDHFGAEPSPLALLAGIAAATSTIRIGTLVLNNDWYHPALLAREVTTIDHLSGGRLELGLGAGHTPQEYAAVGRPFDRPAVRKARLSESIEVIRALLDGDACTFDGEHFTLTDARVLPAAQPHLPLLVAGRGSALLSHAARHADTIGLAGLGRTLPDGHRHEVRWSPDLLDREVELIRAAAGNRSPECNVLVQTVQITEDRQAAAEAIAERVPSLPVEDALATPFLALGTAEQIADQLRTARERWGISYVAVRDGDAFVPVMQQLRAAGAPA